MAAQKKGVILNVSSYDPCRGLTGQPEDLPGTVLWLVSHVSQVVTGIVVPIDGGFSAFFGV